MILHFNGDLQNFDPDQIVGPDEFESMYRPIAATYDAERDMSTVTFAPASHDELEPQQITRLAFQRHQRMMLLWKEYIVGCGTGRAGREAVKRIMAGVYT